MIIDMTHLYRCGCVADRHGGLIVAVDVGGCDRGHIPFGRRPDNKARPISTRDVTNREETPGEDYWQALLGAGQ